MAHVNPIPEDTDPLSFYSGIDTFDTTLYKELFVFEALVPPTYKPSSKWWTQKAVDLLDSIQPPTPVDDFRHYWFKETQLNTQDESSTLLASISRSCYELSTALCIVIVPWTRYEDDDLHLHLQRYLRALNASYHCIIYRRYADDFVPTFGRTASAQFKLDVVANIISACPNLSSVTLYESANKSSWQTLRDFTNSIGRSVFIDYQKISHYPEYPSLETQASALKQYVLQYNSQVSKLPDHTPSQLLSYCAASTCIAYVLDVPSQMLLLATFKSLLKPQLMVVGNAICSPPNRYLGPTDFTNDKNPQPVVWNIVEVGASTDGIVFMFKLKPESLGLAAPDSCTSYLIYLQKKHGPELTFNSVAEWHPLPQPVAITTRPVIRYLGHVQFGPIDS